MVRGHVTVKADRSSQELGAGEQQASDAGWGPLISAIVEGHILFRRLKIYFEMSLADSCPCVHIVTNANKCCLRLQ